ncbi:hypothetical protein Tco_0477890 [Tanacetum coccineum]
MLNKKLQADHWNEMCYQLLKLMIKQERVNEVFECILLVMLSKIYSSGINKKDAEDPGIESGNPTEGNEDSEVLSIEESRVNQEKDASVNSTNTINTVSPTVNAAGIEDNVVDENIVYGCADDSNMPKLEDICLFK